MLRLNKSLSAEDRVNRVDSVLSDVIFIKIMIIFIKILLFNNLLKLLKKKSIYS